MRSAVLRLFRVAWLTALLVGAAPLGQAFARSSNGGDGASSGGSSGASGNGAPHLPSASTYSDGGRGVKVVTRAAETTIGQCSQDDRICVADALEAYAAALRKLSPPLAPELQKLPDIVSRAAHRVRHAKSRDQAAAALKAAIQEVHKTIGFLKADDPILLKAETRQGAFVAETLAVAENKLEKAVGL